MISLLLLPLAHAGTLLAYGEDFSGPDASAFAGSDGWEAGDPSDAWSTEHSGGVWPTRGETGGTWGSAEAADNHLVQASEAFGDFLLDVTLASDDSSGQGVVFRYQDARNFYLFVITGAATGSPPRSPGAPDGAEQDDAGAFLYVVTDGVATLLDSATTTRLDDGTTQVVEVIASGADLDIWLDVDGDGILDASEDILGATDGTFDLGSIGLYCYGSGGDSTACTFDDLEVYVGDADNDGAADFTDNCPSTTNEDQADLDLDGLGDVCDDDVDGDGTLASGDCDDRDAAVNPSAAEDCGTPGDDNCDGETNSLDAIGCSAFVVDADMDGFGAEGGAVACLCLPSGAYSATDTSDCDDTEAAIHVGATETCNGRDDDCDGSVDEGATEPAVWYPDVDLDDWGADSGGVEGCDPPGEDWVLSAGDCNDDIATIHPGAPETCDDIDQDCDGTVDEDATDGATWYNDRDGDGFGNPDDTTTSCSAPDGYLASGDDCDDADSTRYPGAPEYCDGTDDDCDGVVDEDPFDGASVYSDADQDGFGDDSSETQVCGGDDGVGGDCDDTKPGVYPGATEIENGQDDDCDGEIDEGQERIGGFYGGACDSSGGLGWSWVGVVVAAVLRRR